MVKNFLALQFHVLSTPVHVLSLQSSPVNVLPYAPLHIQKMLLWSYENYKKQINLNIFWGGGGGVGGSGIFAGVAALKLKIGPICSIFNSCPSLPTPAKDDRKKFQCVNIVLSNKSGPLLVEFH